MFKVGDKVKLCNPSKYKWIGDAEGKVVKMDKNMSDNVYIQWDVAVCIVCGDKDCGHSVTRKWFNPPNIRHVVTKNEQLLFNFMIQ